MHSAGGGDPSQSLSIVSVVFDAPWLIERNLELSRRLNPGFGGRWIVVDNSPAGDLELADRAEILPGVPRPRAPDRGSTHHALALHKALAKVRTRYVLLLDHDFYVVRPDWIAGLLAHVRARGVALLGSAWNPRWVHQYRDFPSIHFLLIDLDRIPVAEIDVTPAIAGDLWWRLINARAMPWPRGLRKSLKAGRFRDAGWRLRRRFAGDRTKRVEMLVPYHASPAGRPAGRATIAEQSELMDRLPRAYANGWEEHFWQGALFAVHLRRVGRNWTKQSLAADEALLDELLRDAPTALAG